MADNNNKNNLEVCNNKYVFTKRQKAYLPLKRFIGICGSFVGIIVCAILLWWWVLIVNTIVTKGHPIFIQERIGKNKKVFGLIKFRSMKLSADPNMSSRDKDAKNNITKFGNFLRKSSIDETLQLLNIFVGQMAFIGPRPLIDSCDDAITIELRKENGSILLRPGLSGYAQIHKRGDLDPKTKGDMDGYYSKNLNIWMDITIFVKTVLIALRIKKYG